MLWGFGDEARNWCKRRLWKTTAFPPTAMSGIPDNNHLSEVCGILSSWNISASSCKKGSCAPSKPAVSTLMWDLLWFIRHARVLSTLALIFILLLSFFFTRVVPFFFLSSHFSRGLLATLHHQKSDIEISLHVSKRYGVGENEKNDTAGSEGQITKADRGWPRPKAHRIAAVVYNLHSSKSPGFTRTLYMHATQNGSICPQQKTWTQ